MWESLSADEYAEVESAGGAELMCRNGFWWRRIRPFFYRSLIPWQVPSDGAGLLDGGIFQHTVEKGRPTNSHFNLILFYNRMDYGTECLPRKIRRNLRKALETPVEFRRMTDEKRLVEEGFPLYVDFHQRTGYCFRDDRMNRSGFEQWTRSLFKNPKVCVMGAYHEEKLAAFYASCLVDNVVIMKTAVNSQAGLLLRTPEQELHFYRTEASKHPEIKFLYDAFFVPEMGVNEFKLRRGAQVACLPARIHLSGSLLRLARSLKPAVYRQMVGWDEEEMKQYLTEIHSKLE